MPRMVDSEGNEQTTRGFATRSVVIGSGQSLSGEVDLEGFALVGIVMPAAWTAAVLSFAAAAASGGTFNPVYDDAGTEVTVQAAASRAIGVDVVAVALAAFRFLKLRSGTAGAPVAQVGDRTITLVVKG